MPRVLITDNLSPVGVSYLENTPGIDAEVRATLPPEELKLALHEFDGVVIRSASKLTPEILEGQGAHKLKVIVRAGVGVDNIDLPAATAEGILVMNTPAGNTTSTAEHAVAMMLALSRNVAPAHATMTAGGWDRKKFTGSQVAGKTLAVIGLGRIGLTVARIANGMNMRVVGFDPFFSDERAKEEQITLSHDLDEVTSQCDYLSVHTPMTEQTKGMIDADRLSKMKRGVRIINCARGGIVDEQALADALESGQVAGAAVDVFTTEPPPEDHPLRNARNILLTPHLGASTEEAQEQVALEAAEIISEFLLKNEIRYAVNTAPISGAEMDELKRDLDLAYRLGLLLSQQCGASGIQSAKVTYRGEVAGKKTAPLTSCFAAGLLANRFDQTVNLVNAAAVAKERGLPIGEEKTEKAGDFSTLISATIETDAGPLVAAGTIFGNKYLRLIRLGEFQLDAFLDGTLLIYRHIDRPGQIGRVGNILAEYGVNIADMSLGRELDKPGGNSVAVLHVDQDPPAEALQKIADHADVTGVDVVRLPTAGAALPFMR